MWDMIPSLQSCVDCLAPAFTQPTCATSCRLLLAWLMCLGKHSLSRVGENTRPQQPPDHSQRHGLDCYYNFFERSCWKPKDLAYRVAVLILSRLSFSGTITLLVDDTLAHKRGKSVWGLGWWRDAVASTKKRVATASGHNWVVMAVAFCVPGTSRVILALPLLARLHLPGKGQPSCARLAKELLDEILGWFPGREFTVVADGAYACKEMLGAFPRGVRFVGRMRGDAAVYDPRVPAQRKGKRGPKPKKGPRLASPKEAAKKADRKRTTTGDWVWQAVAVTIYGSQRTLLAVSYRAVWPRVLGLVPIRIVVVRDVEGRMDDVYLFTTDVNASLEWVIEQFSWRWSIEVLFRASKQLMQIEAPQHWCKASVEKVAPWVWSMQSVVMVWYLTGGSELPQAQQMRARMGPWDSEWSLRHMIQVVQRATLDVTIQPNSASEPQLREFIQTLQNWALLAA
jgi:DDE superfamily endonuclease/Archaeal putative transposase ISC1217